MRLPRYRPPASMPDPRAPGFGRWLLEQLRSIGDDLTGLSTPDATPLMPNERLDLAAGATRRVSPSPSGITVTLEAPSAANMSAVATLIIESPAGAVTVAALPHVGADGQVKPSLINGARRATFTRSGVVVFHSNGIDGWKTFTEAPAEAGAVGATGPAGPPGANGATGPAGADGAMRLIRRHVFYTDGSCDIIENGVTTTVTLAEFAPDSDGNAYRAWLVPGGTGGTRGGRLSSTADANGPGGPGGGAVFDHTWLRADIEAYIAALGTAIPVIVGAGGPGGAALAAGTGNAVSAIGTQGGVTSFGTLGAAYPGGSSQPNALPTSGVQPGGGGGGWFSAGQDVSSANELGGGPVVTLSSAGADGTYNGGKGDQGSTSGEDTGAGSSLWGGGGGGGNVSGAAQNGRGGGRSMFGVPGAGAGGSVDLTGPAGRNGGAGGQRGASPSLGSSPARHTGGGPAGGAGAVGTLSGQGADGADGILGLYPGESGGGSGGLSCTGVGTVSRGGDGGFPGGSGGSTGIAVFNTGSTSMTIERAGNGNDGVAVVDTLG